MKPVIYLDTTPLNVTALYECKGVMEDHNQRLIAGELMKMEGSLMSGPGLITVHKINRVKRFSNEVYSGSK